MTFKDDIRRRITEHRILGAIGEETHKMLTDEGVKIALSTIYLIRNSVDMADEIEELKRRQLRDIAKENNPALRMKWRADLLGKLLLVQAEILAKQKENQQPMVQNNILINGENVKLDVDITKTLAYYKQALDNAAKHNVHPDSSLEQMDTSNSQATATEQ